MKNIKTSSGERKYYEGFGTHMTAAGWAAALGLPRMTVWQYLQQGLTPEEIMEKRQIKEVNLGGPQRKERVGHRQVETFEKMEELLDFSGYDPDGLEVNIIEGAYRHQIVWNGLIIGDYDPTKDVLRLTGGGRTKLRSPVVPDQQIHHIDGKWQLTAKTKRALRENSGFTGLRR